MVGDPTWPSGYDVWHPSVSSQLRVSPQASYHGRYVNVRRCGGLSTVLLQHKYPKELFVKRMEFLPGSVFPNLVAI